MASKIKYKTQKDFDLDDGLDLPDFDFEVPKPKNKREAVTAVGKAAMKSAAGVVFSPATIEQIIRKGMPASYGEGLDLLAETNESIKSLYNTAAKEFKPTVNQLKQITKQTLPKIKDNIPKSLADRLEKWAKGEPKYNKTLSEDAQRTQALMMELGTIFKVQTAQAETRDKKDEQREYFKQGLDQIRHRDQLGQLDAIRVGVARLATYQDSVLANFQKKSLELQYRQYFATADLLKTARETQAETMARLDAVVKNTALPEYAKIKESERFKDMARNRFIGTIQDKVVRSSSFGRAKGYVTDFGRNITENLRKKITDTAQAALAATDMAAMAADQMAMSKEMGGDSYSDTGEALGGIGAGFGVDYLIGKYKDRISNNKTIAKGGHKLAYLMGNSGHLINEHLRDQNKSWNLRIGKRSFNADWLKSFLAGAAPGLGPDSKMSADELMKMSDPSQFSAQTNKSLTEIIPGLLSHIHREIRMMRTGDESVGLLTYDFEGNSFKDSKKLGRGIRDSLIGKSGREAVANKTSEIIRFIEANGQKLTGSQRKTIIEKLTDIGYHHGSTSSANMVNADTWGGGAHGESISGIFRNLFESDHTGKRSNTLRSEKNQNVFSDLVRDVAKDINDPRARIQAMVNAGQYSLLREAGIIDENNRLNDGQMINDMLYEPTYSDASPEGRRRRRRSARHSVQPGSPSYAHTPSTHSEYSDSKVIEQGLKEVKESITENSTLNKTNEMADTLLRIEEAVINAAILSSTQISPEDIAKAKKNFLDMSVRDAVGSGIRGVGKLGMAALRHGRKIGKRLDNAIFSSIGLGGRLLKTAAGLPGKLFGDLWVKGENFPRMTKVKLNAGAYFDQKTGKALTSFRDISGTVVDSEGNVILDATEIKDSYLKGRGLVGLASLLGKGIAGGLEHMGLISNRLNNLTGLAFKTSKAILKGSIRAIIPVKDVYVKGDEQPTLYRWKFIKGLYVSTRTGKVLSHQKDIDGPVKEDGNVVLSEEQINKGLVDKDGKDIHFTVGNITTSLVKGGLWMAKKVFKAAGSIAGRLKGGVDSLLSGIAGGFSLFSITGKKNLEVSKNSLEVQKEILNVLKDRLPKRKKVFGDVDGDGIREGSYEDLVRKRQKAQADKAGKSTGQGSQTSSGPGLLGSIASMFGFGKKKDSANPDGSGDSLLSQAGDVASIADAAGGKRGIGSRLWGGAKALGGGLMKYGGTALKYGGMLGLGGLGMLGSGLASAAGAVATGATAVGTGLASGAAAFLGSTIALPVTLVALGVAGAYLGYKYLTKKRLNTLSTVRFAQYGFDKSEESKVDGVFRLEDMLEPYVKLEGKDANIDLTKVNLDDMLNLFNVKKENREDALKWKFWFENRFKPVFLGHMAVLRSTHQGLKIADLDSKLKPEEKLSYLTATTLPGVNYNLITAPFSDQKSLTVMDAGVKAAVEVAKVTIEKEKKDSAEKAKKGEIGVMATKAAAAVAAVKEAAGFGPKNLPPLPATKKGTIKENGVDVSVSVYTSSQYILLNKNRLDALQALRLKTYGLVSLDQDKVKALLNLETTVLPFIDFKSGAVDATSTKSVNFNGDGEKILEMVKGDFGISGYRSPRGYKWMTWFQDRFLPTFLSYLQAIYTATGKSDPKAAIDAMKPQDQLSAANAIQSTTASHEGRKVSVWEVTDSPWDNYPLNSDPNSVRGNIDAITELNKSQVMGEVSKTSAIQNRKIDDYKAKNPAPSTGNIVKDFAIKAIDKVQNNTPYRTINADGKGVQATGDYMTGEAITHPGKGAGGDINSLPNASGSGWSAMKDVILGAAKMAGVDPKMLASIAAIESGFNPSARPINKATGQAYSSATGLFQFISDTWNSMVKKYGAKYGIAIGTPPTDPRANALMGAEFIKDNVAFLKGKLKRALTATDIYIAHFLGPAGAVKFLTADPSEIAAKILPEAAQANPGVFQDRQTGRYLTCGEIYNNFTNKLSSRLASSGAASDLGAATPADLAAGSPSAGKQTISQPGYGSSVGDNSGATKTSITAVGKIDIPTPSPAATAKSTSSTPSITPTKPSGSTAGYGSSVSAVSTPLPTKTSNGFGGFDRSSSPSSAEIMAQNKAAKSAIESNVDTISKTLVDSLSVQSESRDMLKSILQQMLMKVSASAGANKVQSDNIANSKPTESEPKAPVSMSRSR